MTRRSTRSYQGPWQSARSWCGAKQRAPRRMRCRWRLLLRLAAIKICILWKCLSANFALVLKGSVMWSFVNDCPPYVPGCTKSVRKHIAHVSSSLKRPSDLHRPWLSVCTCVKCASVDMDAFYLRQVHGHSHRWISGLSTWQTASHLWKSIQLLVYSWKCK